MQMFRFQADALRRLGAQIFVSVGTPEDAARVVADSLVDANLAGHALAVGLPQQDLPQPVPAIS